MSARRIPLLAGLAAVLVLGPASLAGAESPVDTTTAPGGEPAKPAYSSGEVSSGNPVATAAPVIRVYKDSNAWFGENRDESTLAALGKTLGSDWFVHPISDCQSGIPGGTAVVLFTSNGFGLQSATAAQTDPACQASLASFVASGGVLVVDMGDNDGGGGFMAPGAAGSPAFVFPDPCHDATLAAAAAGHPIVLGPDGAVGGGDDLDDSNVDMGCYVAHGNLANGITLPANATVLMTAVFDGPQPILAEYCLGGGRIILDTDTKEYFGQQPAGTGPARFLTNLLSYALSPAARCISVSGHGRFNTDGNGQVIFTLANDAVSLDRVRGARFAFAGPIASLAGSENAATLSGMGTWNGQSGYTFEVSVVDNANWGRLEDTISVVIRDPWGAVVITSFGPQILKQGNIVVAPASG